MSDESGGVDWVARWDEQVKGMRETEAALRKSARRSRWFIVFGAVLFALNLVLLMIPPLFDFGWWASLVGLLISVWIIASGAWQTGSLLAAVRFLHIFTEGGEPGGTDAGSSAD